MKLEPETDPKNMPILAHAPRLATLMSGVENLDQAKKKFNLEACRRFKAKDGTGRQWGIMNPALLAFQSAWGLTPVVRIKPIEIFPESENSAGRKAISKRWRRDTAG